MKCAYKDCHANAARRVRIPGPVDRSLDVCLIHERVLEDMMAKSKCALSTCDNVANAKGCCTVHYGRWYPRRWLDGIAVVTPEQATEFHARWEQATAEREAKRAERADALVKPTHPGVLSEVKSGRWSRLMSDPVPEEQDFKLKVPPVQSEIVRLSARVKELEEQVAASRDRAEKAETERDEARQNAQQLRADLAAAREAGGLGTGESVVDGVRRLAQARRDAVIRADQEDFKLKVPPVQSGIVRLSARVKELEEQVAASRDRAEKAETERDEARQNAQQLRADLAAAREAGGLGTGESVVDGVRRLAQARRDAVIRADQASKFCAQTQTVLREAWEAVGWSPDNSMDFVEFLQEIVTQRDRAQAGEVLAVEQIKTTRQVSTVPSDTLAEPAYLSHLLAQDAGLRAVLESAVARDLSARVLRKDPAVLLSLLTGPVSRLP
jgi:hypothetical protein